MSCSRNGPRGAPELLANQSLAANVSCRNRYTADPCRSFDPERLVSATLAPGNRPISLGRFVPSLRLPHPMVCPGRSDPKRSRTDPITAHEKWPKALTQFSLIRVAREGEHNTKHRSRAPVVRAAGGRQTAHSAATGQNVEEGAGWTDTAFATGTGRANHRGRSPSPFSTPNAQVYLAAGRTRGLVVCE